MAASATPAPSDAGAAPIAAAAAGGVDADATMDDEEGAAAAAPGPVPDNRPIVIQRHKKAKNASPAPDDDRGAAGGGDPLALQPTDAQDVKYAYERAEEISHALGTRETWAPETAEFEAVRNYQQPLTEGGAPLFPIPSPPGDAEELFAPPAAGPTYLDHAMVHDGAPVGNARSAPLPDGAVGRLSEEPNKAPPLPTLKLGVDLYKGIAAHLVRPTNVPTGDTATRKGRSRLFATVFDEVFVSFEQIEREKATPATGWGPIVTVTSSHTGAKEVIHGQSVEFVLRDYPDRFPDRVAIHRKGARYDSAGMLYLEFPAGAGPQMATFLHTFVHLPGGFPRHSSPASDALQADPLRSCDGDAFSLQFYAHDWTFALQGTQRRSQVPNSVVHVVATGDPKAGTASLTIRRASDPCTASTLDLKGAQITVADGAYDRPAVLLTLQSTDSEGEVAVFTRHLHALSGLLLKRDLGPPLHLLATAISTAALCANAPPIGPSPQMQIDQGAGAVAGGGAAPPPAPLLTGEEQAIAATLAAVATPPLGGKLRLLVIGHGYIPQFKAALRSVPNIGLDVLYLQSSRGFRAVVTHLLACNPSGIAEIAFVIDDPELHLIRLMPTGTPYERRARDQAIDSLVSGASAAVGLLRALPGDPEISLFIWDQLDPTKSDPSVVVKEKLEHLYGKSEDVRVLSQFPLEKGGGYSAQTTSVRDQWQTNLRTYRPYPTAGPRPDIPFGWEPQALGVMCQTMLSGAVSRLALRRERDLEARSFHVPVTATIRGQQGVLTSKDQRAAAHNFLLAIPPDKPFDTNRHKIHTLDGRALAVVKTAVTHRPPVPVLRGYAGTKSADTAALEEMIAKNHKTLAIADFGRTQFAAVLAVASAFASSAADMVSKPRYNFGFVLNDVCSTFGITGDDIPAFRLGLSHAAFAISNRALYYVTTLRDRPDVYHGSLAMFSDDDENIAAQGAFQVIQRAAGKASKEGKAALAAAHGEALRNTRINAGGLIADRLYARWAAAATALREITDAAYAPSVAPLAPSPYMDDDDDDDLKAGACVMETMFDPRAGTGTLTTPWEQSPQGAFDDLLVALAITGAPSAVLWFDPEAAMPFVKVMEWANAVYPFPSSTDGVTVPVQPTRTVTADFTPSLVDGAGVAVTSAQFLTTYAESHRGWNIIMVRKGSDDGLLSFAALVKPRMGSPPLSVADEAAAAAALATAADDAATEAAHAAATEALLQAVTEVTADLQAQKALVVETHHLFERQYVDFKGAESMHESSSNAATSKAAMVEVARGCTSLDESTYDSFDPDGLPSVSDALKQLKDTQNALRTAICTYEASLTAAGKEDDDPGKSTHALSFPLPSLPRVASSTRAGGSDGERPIPRETTMSPTTTTLTSPPPLLAARSPPPDRAAERGVRRGAQGRGAQDDLGGGVAGMRANEHNKHENQGGESGAVRRRPRRPRRHGAVTSVTGTAEAETEGDRDMDLGTVPESKSDSVRGAGSK